MRVSQKTLTIRAGIIFHAHPPISPLDRSLRYIAIDCGYIIVYFAVIGFILGIWR